MFNKRLCFAFVVIYCVVLFTAFFSSSCLTMEGEKPLEPPPPSSSMTPPSLPKDVEKPVEYPRPSSYAQMKTRLKQWVSVTQWNCLVDENANKPLLQLARDKVDPLVNCLGSRLRQYYPKQLVPFLYPAAVTMNVMERLFRIREREYNAIGQLQKFVVKPRSLVPVIVPITGLFLGYTFSSLLEMSKNISELEKKFYEEQKSNEKVIQASRINEVTFSSWYSDPRHNRKSLGENYKNIHERMLCMANIEGSLNIVLTPTRMSEHWYLRWIHNITNPFINYLASPILGNGERLRERVRKEKDHLTTVDKINYLLSDKHYLRDESLTKLLQSTRSYFDNHLVRDGSDEELEEFKGDLLRVANLMGVVWGIKGVEEYDNDKDRAQKFCVNALNVFDLVLALDDEEKGGIARHPKTHFNKGFMRYSYMGDLGGLADLKEARRAHPHNAAIVSNITFCNYMIYKENKELLPELVKNLCVLSEAIEMHPKDYLARQIKGILLLKVAVLYNKDNSTKSIEYAKKAKVEFDEIERLRRDDEIKGFEPDQYYYFPKGQVEIAVGANEDALESLRRASYHSGCDVDKDKEPCALIASAIAMLEKEAKSSWSLRRSLWGVDESSFIRDHQPFLREDIDKPIFTTEQVNHITEANTSLVSTFKSGLSKAEQAAREKKENKEIQIDREAKVANIQYVLDRLNEIFQRTNIQTPMETKGSKDFQPE